MKVLVVGSITRDTIIHADTIHADNGGDRALQAPGGTAFYATDAYQRLGATVSVATCLAAADEPWVRKRLAQGVALHVQRSPVTTSFENRYERGERTQRVGAVAPPILLDPALLPGIDWVHLGPLHPDDLDRAWYRATAVPLALDVQGLVRHIDNGRVVARATEDAASLIAGLRWLKAGIDEWGVLLDALGCDESAFVDAHRPLDVLRTHGIDGGRVLRASAPPVCWPAMPRIEHTDPTGAGDVFFAAYLLHAAGLGRSPAEAAPAAAAWVSDFLRARERSTRGTFR